MIIKVKRPTTNHLLSVERYNTKKIAVINATVNKQVVFLYFL